MSPVKVNEYWYLNPASVAFIIQMSNFHSLFYLLNLWGFDCDLYFAKVQHASYAKLAISNYCLQCSQDCAVNWISSDDWSENWSVCPSESKSCCSVISRSLRMFYNLSCCFHAHRSNLLHLPASCLSLHALRLTPPPPGVGLESWLRKWRVRLKYVLSDNL